MISIEWCIKLEIRLSNEMFELKIKYKKGKLDPGIHLWEHKDSSISLFKP